MAFKANSTLIDILHYKWLIGLNSEFSVHPCTNTAESLVVLIKIGHQRSGEGGVNKHHVILSFGTKFALNITRSCFSYQFLHITSTI